MEEEHDNDQQSTLARAQHLDDVMIALQKTFSRVSASSANVPEEDSRALITGSVAFELSLKVDLDEKDHLLLNSRGTIDVKLTGTIETDIRDDIRDDEAGTEPQEAEPKQEVPGDSDG